MKTIMYRATKMTVGVILSIVIAQILQLDFALSAGVITLLTMLDTKRKSLKIAIKRFYTALIALALASIIFYFFKASLVTFGVFLLIFIPFVFKFHANSGLVVNTVLVTHLYDIESITLGHIMNEIALMTIGIVIALLVNIHFINIENEIRDLQVRLEEELKTILKNLSVQLKNQCLIDAKKVELTDLYKTISLGKEKAYQYFNSYYFKENSYFVEYFEMRLQQYYRLYYIHEYLNTIITTQKEAELLSVFTYELSRAIHECNSLEDSLKKVQHLKAYFKESNLPKTREEFEHRAILFQYLNDINEFIDIKKRFFEKNGEIKYCSIR